jgi:hypothetical protein
VIDLKDTNEEAVWGQVEKIGKGTKANYDPQNKTITFCFNRNSETSSDLLKKSRDRLVQELKELGYTSRMKYNGEVIVENIGKEDVVLEKKNHKLIIRLNNKQTKEKPKTTDTDWFQLEKKRKNNQEEQKNREIIF